MRKFKFYLRLVAITFFLMALSSCQEEGNDFPNSSKDIRYLTVSPDF